MKGIDAVSSLEKCHTILKFSLTSLDVRAYSQKVSADSEVTMKWHRPEFFMLSESLLNPSNLCLALIISGTSDQVT